MLSFLNDPHLTEEEKLAKLQCSSSPHIVSATGGAATLLDVLPAAGGSLLDLTHPTFSSPSCSKLLSIRDEKEREKYDAEKSLPPQGDSPPSHAEGRGQDSGVAANNSMNSLTDSAWKKDLALQFLEVVNWIHKFSDFIPPALCKLPLVFVVLNGCLEQRLWSLDLLSLMTKRSPLVVNLLIQPHLQQFHHNLDVVNLRHRGNPERLFSKDCLVYV